MGCTTCKCDAGLSNTGTACTPIMQVTKKIILVPYYDNDGLINGVPLASGPFDVSFFNQKVNNPDKSKRWFPLPELKNVLDERADNKTESFDDGSSVFIAEGDRSFAGLLIKGTPKLKGKIESARCVEVGVFLVDKNGNFIGALDSTGLILNPIKLDEASIAAMLVKTTDSIIQKLKLQFNFHADEKDESLVMIACDELDHNLLSLKGLLDISPVYSSIADDELTVKLKTEYGTVLSPVLDEGLIAADFALYNSTDLAPVVILTAVESPDGIYTLTYAAQTSGDVLFLTPNKLGRDYTLVIAEPILIP